MAQVKQKDVVIGRDRIKEAEAARALANRLGSSPEDANEIAQYTLKKETIDKQRK